MKIAEIFYKLGKRLRKKKEKVTDPKIEKGYSPSDGVEDVSETRGSSSTSPGISNNTVNDGQLSRSKPVFFTECEWILSKLAKRRKSYDREKFFQILQRNYSNEFKGPLDFQKVESKLVQARLLTKTVSEYLSFESESTNSVERYFSNLYPTYKINVFRVNCPARYKSAWIDEGIIYINEGHPAYKHAGRQYKYYHDVVSVAIAIARYTNKINKDSFLNQNFENIATSLTQRERDILLKRYFVEKPQSLKTIGQYYGLSRERIRQIETKALTKLRENGLHIAFLYELFKLGLPNILQIEQLTAINENLGITSKNPLSLIRITSKTINKIMGNTVDFNFCFVGTKSIYLRYYNYPDISKLSIEKWIDKTEIPKEEFKNYLINEGFCFLVEDELETLHSYFSEQHKQYYGQRHPLKYLIIRSLKSIGCPAHYSDITEKARGIGGEKYKNCSFNSIHGALSLYNEFVWVGKRGVYGLKEWGLSPPDKSLEDQIYSILKDSGKPLFKESIAIELSKKRPYFSEISLNLILGKSDQIIKTPDNLYHIANKEDIEVEKSRKARMNKMSNAMEEVFREWEKQKNSE